MQKGTWHKIRRVNIELIFGVELDSVEIQEPETKHYYWRWKSTKLESNEEAFLLKSEMKCQIKSTDAKEKGKKDFAS